MAGQEMQVRSAAIEAALSPGMSTAIAASSSRETAMVKARFQVAMAFPRDEIALTLALVDQCNDPVFAEAAIYDLPVGGHQLGLSVRFAEYAIRRMKNCSVNVTMTPLMDGRVEVTATGMDLESNTELSASAIVTNTVERSKEDFSRKLVDKRMNSKGQPVYVYIATDDEMFRECNRIGSKLFRNISLRLIPSEAKTRCFDQCLATCEGKFTKNARQFKEELAAYAQKLKVSPDMLHEWLGHGIDKMDRDEYYGLMAVLKAVAGGELTFRQAVDERHPNVERRDAEVPPARPTAQKSKASPRDDAKPEQETRRPSELDEPPDTLPPRSKVASGDTGESTLL